MERGFIGPEEIPAAEPEPAPDGAEPGEDDAESGERESGEDGDEREAEDEAEEDGLTPLSDRLVADLTAHRTAGLRDALADNPDVALLVVVHAAVLRCFYGGGSGTCADIRFTCGSLARDADGIEDSKAAGRTAARPEAWRKQLPPSSGDPWAWLVEGGAESRRVPLA